MKKLFATFILITILINGCSSYNNSRRKKLRDKDIIRFMDELIYYGDSIYYNPKHPESPFYVKKDS